MLLVPAADVTGSQPTKMITAAGLFLRLQQTLRRSRFRNFVESRQRLESQRRSKWAKRFKCHKLFGHSERGRSRRGALRVTPRDHSTSLRMTEFVVIRARFFPLP